MASVYEAQHVGLGHATGREGAAAGPGAGTHAGRPVSAGSTGLGHLKSPHVIQVTDVDQLADGGPIWSWSCCGVSRSSSG